MPLHNMSKGCSMKKFRDIQKVKSKRIVPGFSFKNLGTVLLSAMLLPYIITILFGNPVQGREDSLSGEVSETLAQGAARIVNDTSLGQETLPLELYVADKLAGCMGEDCELEALKAQAVLIRTNLLMQGEEKGNIWEINVYDEEYGTKTIGANIWKAVTETAGVGLFFKGKPAYAAYFAVSNGATRNGEEVLLSEYPYLKSVPCSHDFLSEEFISSSCMSQREFERIWQQIPESEVTQEEVKKYEELLMDGGEEIKGIRLYRDSAGYVLYVEYNDRYVKGEQFRETYHLASSAFTLGRLKEQIIITVKGAGHGLGMSQFGANEMAKDGENYVDILNYFFRDITITKIE